MDMGNWVRDLINYLGGSYIFKPKVANVLFLGNDESCKTAVISSLSDKNVEPAPYLTSWVSSIGNIMFNFFDLGRPRIAHAVWRDYGAKMDAVVYIVDATRANEQFVGPRRDLHDLLSDEAFANLPFLILCTTPSFGYTKEELCSLLDLASVTTGMGLLELAKANAHPLEVFVAEKYNTTEYLRGFKWLSHNIK
ncbi:GTP-binding protein SAR2-like isoform X2 [Castanea sativa]|uniref:GTP-binding protein SAR2-like isoform X2 n=1 Tax=Castanea sativa TaxID=21020 RepID=UPI003F64F9AE